MKFNTGLASLIILLSLICNLWLAAASASAKEARAKVGVALGGGGTRGYAHVGVLRVLKRNSIPIDMIVGTSMGSIVGGLFCAGLSCDKIEKTMVGRGFGDALELSIGKMDLFVMPIAVVPRTLVKKKSYSGLYKGDKLAKFINARVPADRRSIENLPVKFGAVTFNLLDGKGFLIKSGNLGTALQASSAVPELRQPVPLEGRLLVDGGVRDNIPCRKTRELGADIVIAVNVNERLYPIDDSSFRTIGSVSNRCVTANLEKLAHLEENYADIVIHPEVSSIKLLSASKLDMERAIRAGEKAAEEALPKILEVLKQKWVPETTLSTDKATN